MKDDAILTSTEAREEFGWSRDMMTKLLRSGALPFTTDPLDKRLKWVKRGDVVRLNEASRKRQRQPQPTHDAASNQAHRASVAGTALPPRAAITSSRLSPVPPMPLATPKRNGTRAARSSGSYKLKPSDQVVLAYLRTLCAITGTDTTPPVGYEIIAQRCGICPRQAQICCDRLVAAHRLERLGYGSINHKQKRQFQRAKGRPNYTQETTGM